MEIATSFTRFDGEERIAVSVRVLDSGIKGVDWGSGCGGRHCCCRRNWDSGKFSKEI